MALYTYDQSIKNAIRHNVLSMAVNALTLDRQYISCVPRTYIRQVIDYFLQMDEDEPVRKEAQNIDLRYVSDWENLFDSTIGHKRIADLSVCYLSGPQPENDFNELISLGVLPQNIWAFENDRMTYLHAVEKYNAPTFPQPKIVKMSVENFFKLSPRKFDIIYIDACGSFVSTQHALRCVSTLLYYQRLNSPGVLITNFSKPDYASAQERDALIHLMALYFAFKNYPDLQLDCSNGMLTAGEFEETKEKVQQDFELYYGQFITSLLSDLASIIVPLQRFGELAQFSNLFSAEEISAFSYNYDISTINGIKNNAVCRWVLTINWLTNNGVSNIPHNSKYQMLLNELSGMTGNISFLIKGILFLVYLKAGTIGASGEIGTIRKYFDQKGNFYQFLDRVTPSLFFDVVINQLTYPLHTNNEKSKAFQYCAKQTEMFTDLLVLDECRYLYEWLPTIHQIENAMKNKSWQYTFRFALDALVKQRINYNDEFFFQGSVVHKCETPFDAKIRSDRERIGG